MKKLKNIIQGYWYWLWQPKAIKDKAAKRMKICETSGKDGKECENKKGPICGLCGCVLRAKTSAPDEVCPELKWGRMKLNETK